MLHISKCQQDLATFASHRTAVLHVNMQGRVVSLNGDGVQMLAACHDVIGIDAENRLAMPAVEAFADVLERCCAGAEQTRAQIETYSDAAGTRLTIDVLHRPGLGATLVLFANGLDIDDKVSALTPRERDILFLAAKGLRRDRMAHALGVSIATVDLHCAGLRRKMGAKTTSQAVAKALTRFAYWSGSILAEKPENPSGRTF